MVLNDVVMLYSHAMLVTLNFRDQMFSHGEELGCSADPYGLQINLGCLSTICNRLYSVTLDLPHSNEKVWSTLPVLINVELNAVLRRSACHDDHQGLSTSFWSLSNVV